MDNLCNYIAHAPEKIQVTSPGFEPLTSEMLVQSSYQLSYEVTEKHQDLVAREVGRVWKVQVIASDNGAMGIVPLQLESFLGCTGVSTPVDLVQKATLLGTATILTKTLER